MTSCREISKLKIKTKLKDSLIKLKLKKNKSQSKEIRYEKEWSQSRQVEAKQQSIENISFGKTAPRYRPPTPKNVHDLNL